MHGSHTTSTDWVQLTLFLPFRRRARALCIQPYFKKHDSIGYVQYASCHSETTTAALSATNPWELYTRARKLTASRSCL